MQGSFSTTYVCNNTSCKERVTIAGTYQYDVIAQTSYDDPPYAPFFVVKFCTPALPILQVPKATPEKVTDAIAQASSVIWLDPNAAVNRLRVDVEELLNSLRISKTRVNRKTRARTRMNLHDRIVRFAAVHAVAGEALEAVKWVGNAGSHMDQVAIDDALNCAEVLEYALRDLYDKTDAAMVRRIRTINKAKGLPRRKARTR